MPGGKSGFNLIGDSGPGIDDIEDCLHILLKHCVVGLMRG